MDHIYDILRQYPAVALFLTVGIGFLLGKLHYKSFSLGSVTAVLLTGVVIGQLDIKMPGPIKMVFFMMFLFSIGYSVSPQFFRSLRGSGLKQALFAVMMSACCFGVTYGLAKLMDYTTGETVGLFSGSQTCSALMGVGSEAITRMSTDAAQKARELSIIPVCYAVTYIFGTLGTVIILGNLGPRLLGGLDKVKRETAELERSLNSNDWENDPAVVSALRQISYRSYLVENTFFATPRTVTETENYFRDNGLMLYVDRVRHGDTTHIGEPSTMIALGDEIVVSGQRDFIVRDTSLIGSETADSPLLSYPVERIPVLVAARDCVGMTVDELSRQPFMHGLGIESITRKGQNVELGPETIVRKGDSLMLMGEAREIKRAAPHLGHMDRPTVSSDLMFVGLSIFIGGIIGALTIFVGDIPLSFGTSGGALIAGLVLGWIRSRRPTFGHIPKAALWLMNNLGLNVFVAVVGLESATSFVAGVREVGWLLLIVGAVGTTIPLLIGIWLGRKVFHFHPAITLGCCAGTRTCTASLGAVQDALGSTAPAIGYTVTYAVSNILLVIWGMVTVLLI